MTNCAATINFADASRNLLPDLPELPPGWIWAAAACGGNYHVAPDPKFVGDRGPEPDPDRLR